MEFVEDDIELRETFLGADSLSSNSDEEPTVIIHRSSIHRVWNDPKLLVYVASMPYQDFCVSIYRGAAGQQPDRYYYDLVMLLDPRSISSRLNRITGQATVRFTVEMRNQDVERRVLAFLREELGLGQLRLYRVQLLPYNQVRLITKGGTALGSSFRLPEHPTPYLQMKENLKFHLICGSEEAAGSLAEEMRTDPDYLAQCLALELTMPAGSPTTLDFNIVRPETESVKGAPWESLLARMSQLDIKMEELMGKIHRDAENQTAELALFRESHTFDIEMLEKLISDLRDVRKASSVVLEIPSIPPTLEVAAVYSCVEQEEGWD